MALPLAIFALILTIMKPKMGTFFIKNIDDTNRRKKGLIFWGKSIGLIIGVVFILCIIFSQLDLYFDNKQSASASTSDPTPINTPTPQNLNSIVGLWFNEESSDGEYYQFFQDGTFFYEGFYPPAYYESGNWKNNGNSRFVITPTKQGYDSTNLVTVIGPISSEYNLNGDTLTHSNGNYHYTRFYGSMPTPAPYVSPTPTPTPSPDEIKAQAKSVSYRELLTNSEAHYGEMVKVSGEVIQVQNDEGGLLSSPSTTFLVGIDDPKNQFNYINQIVMIQSIGKVKNIMKGDRVDMYGLAMGTTHYTTVLGADNEVPYITYQYAVYYM